MDFSDFISGMDLCLSSVPVCVVKPQCSSRCMNNAHNNAKPAFRPKSIAGIMTSLLHPHYRRRPHPCGYSPIHHRTPILRICQQGS